MRPDMKILMENPDMMEELGINAIVHRKGIDGKTPKPQSAGSPYPWNQLILIIGEEANTKEGRREVADKLVAHFNSNAVKPTYTYPRKMKFGEDATTGGRFLLPIDLCLLDNDVVALMKAAYPDMNLHEIAKYDEIMKTFWSDIEHGHEAIEDWLADSDEEEDD